MGAGDRATRPARRVRHARCPPICPIVCPAHRRAERRTERRARGGDDRVRVVHRAGPADPDAGRGAGGAAGPVRADRRQRLRRLRRRRGDRRLLPHAGGAAGVRPAAGHGAAGRNVGRSRLRPQRCRRRVPGQGRERAGLSGLLRCPGRRPAAAAAGGVPRGHVRPGRPPGAAGPARHAELSRPAQAAAGAARAAVGRPPRPVCGAN